jgi:hypothetical protein
MNGYQWLIVLVTGWAAIVYASLLVYLHIKDREATGTFFGGAVVLVILLAATSDAFSR